MALNAGARRLYVLNRIANTLAVIDTAADAVLREIPVGSFDPTPTFIHPGRGFLYDAKLSGNGTMSCASCHVDAEMDMLAWDLGNPFGKMERVTVTTFGGGTFSSQRHPMKGPMTTQTLRGLRGLDPLHWRGDRTSFLAFNLAFPDLFGGPQLAAVDMAAYRDFITSIVFQPNPNQNLDRTLRATFAGANPIAGRNTYQNFVFDSEFEVRCLTCHAPTGRELPAGNGTVRQVMADIRLTDAQHIKVPHLRNLSQKTGFTNTPGAASIVGFGFSHDGRDSTLFNHFLASRFRGLTNNNSGAKLVKSNLVALLLCFDTGTAPAVGYTITPENVNAASISNDWVLLERQATQRFRDSFITLANVTNISFVAKGMIDGQRRSLLFRPATADYGTDKSNLGPFTHAELVAKVRSGDTLSVMGVPTVSGQRMGMDRDWNGVLAGDEPVPRLTAVRSAAGVNLSWPANNRGVVLEFSVGLSPPDWVTETSVQSVEADRRMITVPMANQNRFYRLRDL